MGILSGMLVVLCVKIFTGKKFPGSYLKKNEGSCPLNLQDSYKNKTPDKINIGKTSFLNRIKMSIAQYFTKK